MYDIEYVRSRSPLLLMGGEVFDFRKGTQYPVRSVRTSDDVRELVAYYTGVEQVANPLVVEDLSFLDGRSSFLLLKFVEESPIPIILLSLYDRVSPIILSRMRIVKKKPLQTAVKSLFGNPSDMFSKMGEELKESHTIERQKFMLENSPILYLWSETYKYVRNRNKVYQLLK